VFYSGVNPAGSGLGNWQNQKVKSGMEVTGQWAEMHTSARLLWLSLRNSTIMLAGD